MTTPTQARIADRDNRLSQLIQLKRAERPDLAFWDEFQRSFRSRQLTTLVRVQPWYTRLFRISILIARKAAAPTAALGAVAVTFVAVHQISMPQQRDTADTSIEPIRTPTSVAVPIQPRFVVDIDKQNVAPLEAAPSLSPAFSTSPPATYQITVMAKPQGPTPYELRSSPKALTRATDEDASSEPAQSHGAKVISTERQF